MAPVGHTAQGGPKWTSEKFRGTYKDAESSLHAHRMKTAFSIFTLYQPYLLLMYQISQVSSLLLPRA